VDKEAEVFLRGFGAGERLQKKKKARAGLGETRLHNGPSWRVDAFAALRAKYRH